MERADLRHTGSVTKYRTRRDDPRPADRPV